MNYKLASSTWDKAEYDAINRVINSDMFSMGKEVAQYEKNFADFFGSKYALMVSSGSAANLLMIAALFYTKNEKYKLQRGDEVIVPAVSWSTTYFPLQQYGLKVKFVDIDKNTLNFDLEKLEAAISAKTKVIFAVNLLGNPNDFKTINTLVDKHNLFLIEDNCESMGATFDNRQAGTFGVMGSYSSFFSHHISTMEGGCVTTDDEELYHVLLCLRAHGWTRNLPEFNHVTGQKSSDPFEESFKFVLPGYNTRPLEMSGAIGIEQLKKLPSFIANRRQNGEKFVSLFKDNPHFSIQKEVGQSSWFGFAIIVNPDSKYSRKDIVDMLTANGIECRPIVSGNFLKNKEVLQHFDYEVAGDTPNADLIDSHGLFVGNHQVAIENEINLLYSVLPRD